jgi:vacuolar-type H+-ATPase subunit F/Vma7
MSFGVRVICRPEIAAGFSLAGLKVLPTPGAAGAISELGHLVQQPEIGVVLIEQGFYDALPAELRATLARRPLPMLVPFAGPVWEKAAEDVGAYIVELLRQAIGYRVRLR